MEEIRKALSVYNVVSITRVKATYTENSYEVRNGTKRILSN